MGGGFVTIKTNIQRKAMAMKQEITGHTALYCLLGSPVAHSISPQMHNASFIYHGIDARYLAFDVKPEQLADAVHGLKAIGVKGFNLTMPLKREMVPFCDRLSPAAEICGAVNTIINENGILTGTTTDGIGYLLSAKDAGLDLRGKKMVQLGAGGAGVSTLVQAALDGTAQIDLFNAHARPELLKIVHQLQERTHCDVRFHLLADQDALRQTIAGADLLVNTTPVGMAPDMTGQSLITDPSWFHPNLVVSDMIYEPMETKLLALARQAGCKTFNGLYMLLYQGAASFKIWTGLEMPVEEIKKKYFSGKKR